MTLGEIGIWSGWMAAMNDHKPQAARPAEAPPRMSTPQEIRTFFGMPDGGTKIIMSGMAADG